MKEYDIYLFDCDGTLIDTSELIYQSYVETCRDWNAAPPRRSDVYAHIGIPLRTQIERYLGPLSEEEYMQAQKLYMDYQYARAENALKIFPGIDTLLRSLRNAGKKTAVVTSRRRESLLRYLALFNLESCFDEFITPEDTTTHKPEPGPVLEALHRFAAGTSLFIGDSLFDIESGNGAGVDTAFVSWSKSPLPPETIPTFTVKTPREIFTSEQTHE
ncbi:MAG: HAD family hydrolase [Fibrobacterota bacterium]